MQLLLEIIQLIIIGLGVLVAWCQLKRMNAQTRAEFTYKIYKDLLEWLKLHEECRDWIFKLNTSLESNFDRWEFDDYLGYFVAIWSFKKRDLIDLDIVYDLFSDYLISIYEANNFELEKIIKDLREKENKPDLYQEIIFLYSEMKNYETNLANKKIR